MPFSCLLLSRLFCFLPCFPSLRVFWRWCCCCCCCICRRSSFSSSSSSSSYHCCLVAGAALACLGGISTRSSSRRLSGEYNKCDSWDSSRDYESELLLCDFVGVTVVSECIFCESGVLACVRVFCRSVFIFCFFVFVSFCLCCLWRKEGEFRGCILLSVGCLCWLLPKTMDFFFVALRCSCWWMWVWRARERERGKNGKCCRGVGAT